jgi:hypothetical protein
MNQELLQQIEQAVRKVLEEQSLTVSPQTSAQKFLAIFDAAQVDLSLPLQALQECIEGGCIVQAIVSDLAATVLDVDAIRSICGTENVSISGEITNLKPFIEDFPQIVLPIFSDAMAAKLALGLVDTPCAYLVFQALLRNSSVVAASDMLEETANGAISALRKNYIEKLVEFGIEFVSIGQLAQTILRHDDATHYCPVKPIQGKTVISASVITNLSPTVRELVYENPAIITPLAHDLAKQRGIQLIPAAKS